MNCKRKLAAGLVWLYPILFVLLLHLLEHLLLFPHDALFAVLLIVAGPVFFVVLLSCLLFDKSEKPDVRCARASRRLGTMAKLAALGVVLAILTIPAVFQGSPFPEDDSLAEVVILATPVFLFAAMLGFTLAAIIFRLIALESPEGGGARDAVIVSVAMVVLGVIFLPVLDEMSTRHRPPYSCSNNLKQMGLVCKMFANENEGWFPELSSRAGYLSMVNKAEGYKFALMPEYVSQNSVLFCPRSELWETNGGQFTGVEQDLFDQSSYVYLGYAVTNKDELETFYQCYRDRIAAGLPFNEDIPAPAGRGSGGGDKLLRLREGAERFYITDVYRPDGSVFAQSNIPILIEHPGNHKKPRGVNVLYMDGHVKLCPQGEWPSTPRTFEIVAAIEALKDKTPAK